MNNGNKYILKLLLWLIVIFAIGKMAFLCYNHHIQPITAGDLFGILGYGFLLDLRTAALMTVVPALAVTFMKKGLRWLLVPYFILLGIAIAAIIVADMAMYEFWEFKFCAVHLSYAASPEGATNSVSIGYLAVRALIILTFVLLVSLPAIRMIPSKHQERDIKGLILVIVLAVIPVGVKQCYHRGPLFLSHAATNPVYRFAVSFFDTRSYEVESDTDEVVAAYQTSDEISDTLLLTQRPNVLFIQMESFGGKFIKELGGIPDVAPNFSRLIPDGIFWDQYYSNSFRTDRGTVSAYSGWISYPTISPMKEAWMHSQLSSLSFSFRQAGYQTGYMYAGPMTNMGKEAYLADMGIECLMDEQYFKREELNSSWGAHDSTSAMKMYHTIAEIDPAAQWMLVWQTISSHEPWDVPYHRLEDEKLNAFAYTDQCVGDLIDSLRTLPVWDKLLVIIIPDHGFLYEQTYDNAEFFHSPMLWLGGAVKEPRRMHTLMNQSDIAATLLAQMGRSHDEYPWSRNVLSPDYKPFVYCNYPTGIFYKDEHGEALYDLSAQTPVPVGEPVDETRLSKALSILHASYSLIKKP